MEHTTGKLTFRGFSIYAADGKTPVADTCLNASVAQHDEANARRLVAQNEARAALLRRALEALDGVHAGEHQGGVVEAIAAAPQQPAPQPLTDQHLQDVAEGHAYIEGTDPQGPDDWECSDVIKAFVCGARYAERKHGIGEQP